MYVYVYVSVCGDGLVTDVTSTVCAHTCVPVRAERPLFNANLAGHARGITRGWASMRKRALTSEDGLALTQYLIVTIGQVNQMYVQVRGQRVGWRVLKGALAILQPSPSHSPSP